MTRHELDALVAAWEALRRPMLCEVPEPFTRDEWAYLLAFIGADSLLALLTQAFGPRDSGASLSRIARSRGEVAVWLPNNVSLLGPLTLVLVSLAGNPLRMKGGSRSEDLTLSFLGFALRHATEPLATWLSSQVTHATFDHSDPRQAEMAANASVHVVFGGDTAARAVMAMPRRLGSVWLPFVDRRSEVWMEPAAITDESLANVLRVFAVYGQAGCTSPRRVVLLDSSTADARALRDRLVSMWPSVVASRRVMHLASSNLMAQQWARALGWDATLTFEHAAVLGAGATSHPEIDAPMWLPIVAATRTEAAATLPDNVQTLGHVFVEPQNPAWLSVVASSAIARFVPVARMHHFGALWDGYELLRGLFEHVEVVA